MTRPDNRLILVLFSALCIVSWPGEVSAQCDHASAGNPGSVQYQSACSGGNASQVVFATQSAQLTAQVICQDGNWKQETLDTATFQNLAYGTCEQATQGTPPGCVPTFGAPAYMGVNYGGFGPGKHVFFWPYTDNDVDSSGSGCVPRPELSRLNNVLSAPGCCAAACQDQASCEAQESPARTYRAETCKCEELTCSNPQDCDSSPPCTVDQVYNEGCDCCISPPEGSPIVIDLADNGITFSSPQSGRLFDFYGWGTPVRVSWPISSDAYWLALDRNHNGAVDNASELFGNLTPLANGQRAEHGYEALREFDSNADGRIDKSDPVFSRLVLWRTSADASGMQLLPIAFSPVLAIDLNTQEVGKKDQWGNRFKYRSRVELESGVNRWSYDVFVVMNFGDVTKRR